MAVQAMRSITRSRPLCEEPFASDAVLNQMVVDRCVDVGIIHCIVDMAEDIIIVPAAAEPDNFGKMPRRRRHVPREASHCAEPRGRRHLHHHDKSKTKNDPELK